jgi:hypothetical protein
MHGSCARMHTNPQSLEKCSRPALWHSISQEDHAKNDSLYKHNPGLHRKASTYKYRGLESSKPRKLQKNPARNQCESHCPIAGHPDREKWQSQSHAWHGWLAVARMYS